MCRDIKSKRIYYKEISIVIHKQTCYDKKHVEIRVSFMLRALWHIFAKYMKKHKIKRR